MIRQPRQRQAARRKRRATPRPDDSVRTLIQSSLRALHGLAWHLTRKREDAADLVQATCLRALERAATLRHRTNVLGWMFQVMRNLHVDQKRRPDCRSLSLHDNLAWDPTPVPLWRMVPDEQLDQATARLLPEQREVWQLFHVHRLNQREIARRLGVPRATVATRMYRARVTVRRTLAPALAARLGGGPDPVR